MFLLQRKKQTFVLYHRPPSSLYSKHTKEFCKTVTQNRWRVQRNAKHCFYSRVRVYTHARVCIEDCDTHVRLNLLPLVCRYAHLAQHSPSAGATRMAPGVDWRVVPLKKHQGIEKISLLKNGAEMGADSVSKILYRKMFPRTGADSARPSK